MKKCFTPIQLGNLTLKNRFMMAPMENGLAAIGGGVTDRLCDFFAERAKNDVAIIMTGSIGVSPEGRGLPTQLSLYEEAHRDDLKKLVDRVHEAGAAIGAQLYHAGRQASEAITGLTPVAPSAMPCAILGNHPKEITLEEMEDIKEKFVQASKWSIEAGFDLIEIHFAHGYLLHSFLSPHSNHRTDEYGGSFENRMRYPMEVLNAVLAAVDGKVPVTIRISADEYLEDGLHFDEVKLVCKEVEKAGVAAISLTAGSYDSVEYAIQPMFIPQGFLIPYSEHLKKEVQVPVIVAARLNNADLIEDTIETGKADMVAIGRGLIADEQLIVKMKEGKKDEIRYCVACNQGCIDRVLGGMNAHCLVNPRAGQEKERPVEKAASPKNVVVIGGGPSGMEAAVTACDRGHKVTLISPSLGGKLPEVATPPEKDTFMLFDQYLIHQVQERPIQVVEKKVTSPEDLREYNPDDVIVAIGADPVTPKIPGVELPHVVSADSVLNRRVTLSGDTVIIGGGLVGSETAKFLGSQGVKVTILEMADSIANGIGATFIGHLFATLEKLGVTVRCGAKVTEITPDEVRLEEGSVPAKNVVIAVGYRSNAALVEALEKEYSHVSVVGDAKAPRRILDAVDDAYAAAQI